MFLIGGEVMKKCDVYSRRSLKVVRYAARPGTKCLGVQAYFGLTTIISDSEVLDGVFQDSLTLAGFCDV
jgi:hypothetical protein